MTESLAWDFLLGVMLLGDSLEVLLTKARLKMEVEDDASLPVRVLGASHFTPPPSPPQWARKRQPCAQISAILEGRLAPYTPDIYPPMTVFMDPLVGFGSKPQRGIYLRAVRSRMVYLLR